MNNQNYTKSLKSMRDFIYGNYIGKDKGNLLGGFPWPPKIQKGVPSASSHDNLMHVRKKSEFNLQQHIIIYTHICMYYNWNLIISMKYIKMLALKIFCLCRNFLLQIILDTENLLRNN
mgnify:CR=1 FL=1